MLLLGIGRICWLGNPFRLQPRRNAAANASAVSQCGLSHHQEGEMQRSGILSVLLGVLAMALTGSQLSTAAPGSRVSGGGQYTGTAGLTYVTVNAIQKPDGSVS